MGELDYEYGGEMNQDNVKNDSVAAKDGMYWSKIPNEVNMMQNHNGGKLQNKFIQYDMIQYTLLSL